MRSGDDRYKDLILIKIIKLYQMIDVLKEHYGDTNSDVNMVIDAIQVRINSHKRKLKR